MGPTWVLSAPDGPHVPWYQGCVTEADIKGSDKKLHPMDTADCNYLSLPLIPASGTQVLKRDKMNIWQDGTQVHPLHDEIFMHLSALAKEIEQVWWNMQIIHSVFYNDERIA